MDGFDPATGIVVLAATNRPEVLDPALLRPGRFDRQVTIPLPTLPERLAILQVHSRGKRLDARRRPRGRGAGDARLLGGRPGQPRQRGGDRRGAGEPRGDRPPPTSSEARDRIILGRREGSNVLLPEEKHAVAVHEAGHALVAAYSRQGRSRSPRSRSCPPARRSASPSSSPSSSATSTARTTSHAMLAVCLGGRASELVVLGQGSTGAANDLAKATELATKMVREFGLSSSPRPRRLSVGRLGVPRRRQAAHSRAARSPSRPRRPSTPRCPGCSREAERAGVVGARTSTATCSTELVDLLLANETVDGSEVYALAGRSEPVGGAGVTMAPDRKVAAADDSNTDVKSNLGRKSPRVSLRRWARPPRGGRPCSLGSGLAPGCDLPDETATQ